MDRRIRDTLHKAGASYEYIMSRGVEVSIRIPTNDERRKGQGCRAFFAAPEEYIEESVTYLRTAARYMEMEEPSLLSIQYSIGIVMLHWLTHDDLRVWRAPAERSAVGLATTFFPEVQRIELIHLFDEDTAGKFSYRSPLEPSPLPFALTNRFEETELIQGRAEESAMDMDALSNEPDDAVPTSSMPTPDEILDQALELSARLEARKTDIAALGEFLATQPESLATQGERIMALARNTQDAAAEALKAFLAQHRIAPQELNERRHAWLASRRATDSMVPPASAGGRIRPPPRGAHVA